jgi:hypothetical protein
MHCLSATNLTALSPAASSNNATIVTAYFQLPSKHTSAEYGKWMANMLSMKDAMVVFTSPDLVPMIQQLRSGIADRSWCTDGRNGIFLVRVPLGVYKNSAGVFEAEPFCRRRSVRHSISVYPAPVAVCICHSRFSGSESERLPSSAAIRLPSHIYLCDVWFGLQDVLYRGGEVFKIEAPPCCFGFQTTGPYTDFRF